MSQQDTIPVRNLALGLAAGFGAVAAIVIMVLLLSQLGLDDGHEKSTDLISERLKPVGEVNVEGDVVAEPVKPTTIPPTEDKTTTKPVVSYEPSRIDLAQGEKIYNSACALCHATGIAGAPKFGEKKAWAPRVAKGLPALFTTALQGLNAMPPKGGQPALPDEDVKSAVAYMVYQVAPDEIPLPPSKPETTPATGFDLTGFDLAQGEQAYNTVCAKCHALGILGAPKFGDKNSWTPRITKSMDALVANALQGFKGETGVMPSKGGEPQLSDEEVKAAVAYMLDAVGAGGEKVATLPETATEEPAEPAASPAEATAPADVTPPKPSLDLAKGEQTYKSGCFACHDTGAAGAPKLGDSDGWTPRIAKGMDTLFTNALQGFQGSTGVMPPKGGLAHLSDDDVKAAVAYMVSKAQ